MGCACLLGCDLASGRGGRVRLLPFSVIMLEPEMGTGLKVAQKNGAEEGNRWDERRSCVVRIGGAVCCTCLLGGDLASGGRWCVRLLPLSVVMLEPETGAGREVAQKDGAEKENKWPERKPFVVRVGGRVGCACVLGGELASCRETCVRLLPLTVVILEPEIRAGREVAQKNGAEKGNRWPERKPFVVRTGGRVGCTCLLVGGLASGGGLCVRLPTLAGVILEPEIGAGRKAAQKNAAKGGSKLPERRSCSARVACVVC